MFQLNSIAAIFFPKICCLCKKLGNSLCNDCLVFFNYKQRTENLENIDLSSFLTYDNKIKDLLHLIKYEHQYDALKILAKHIEKHHEIFESCLTNSDYWIPVPYHQSKIRQRGYNLVEELFLPLFNKVKIQKVDLFKRKKNTQPLFSHSINKRQKIIKGSFEIHIDLLEDLSNKSILIVDDISASKSTLIELIQLIKNNEDSIKINCLTLTNVL